MSNKTKITWANEKAKLGDLIEYDKNPVQISERNAGDLADSLVKYDHPLPYIAAGPKRKDGTYPLLDGHQRKQVEVELNGVPLDTIVDVRVPSRNLTEAEKQELIIRLRKNTGEFDMDKLANWFDVPQLLDWGFSEKELELGGFEFGGGDTEPTDAEPQINRAEELQAIWNVQEGDLWKIGGHRLLCGDSTNIEQIKYLMSGELWDIGFTSPPYNSGNADTNHDYKKPTGESFYQYFDDDLPVDDYMALCFGVLESYQATCANIHALFWDVMYNANSRDTYGKIIFSDKNPFKVKETIVWNKNGGFPVAGTNILSRNTELIFLLSTEKKYLSNQTKENCIYWNRWDISVSGTQNDEEKHKARFPVDLPKKAIEDFSLEDMIVLDLFMGTGTTMVAAQNTKRRGYGAELVPAYCSVTLQRMKDAFPDIEIELLGNFNQ